MEHCTAIETSISRYVNNIMRTMACLIVVCSKTAKSQYDDYG